MKISFTPNGQNAFAKIKLNKINSDKVGRTWDADDTGNTAQKTASHYFKCKRHRTARPRGRPASACVSVWNAVFCARVTQEVTIPYSSSSHLISPDLVSVIKKLCPFVSFYAPHQIVLRLIWKAWTHYSTQMLNQIYHEYSSWPCTHSSTVISFPYKCRVVTK